MDHRDPLLSIGRFAQASGLTVKALRHYDEIGLLRPAHVDGWTAYRYYDPEQLQDAVAIRRLRQLEVPLDGIARMLHADDRDLREALSAHRRRLESDAADRRRQLAEIDRLLSREEKLVLVEEIEIDVVDVPALRLAASVRQVHIDDMDEEVPRAVVAVARWLAEHGWSWVGPPVAVFRSGDAENWHLVEAGAPVGPDVVGDGLVGVHEYAASRAATYLHVGAYTELDPVAQRFIAAVGRAGLRFTQPIRIEYLSGDPAVVTPAEQRARLVWPVE